MVKRQRALLLLLLSLLFCLHAVAQKPNYQTYQHISAGPEASVINHVMQDSQGLIWIGSDKGLYSYDGYATQPHFVYGEPSNSRIYCGVVLEESYLYLGADNGLLIYNYKEERYEATPVAFPRDIRALTHVDGELWIGTLHGLYRYDLMNVTLERIDKKHYPGLSHETIYSLLTTTTDSESLYIGTYNGLCRYDFSSRTMVTISLPSSAQKSNLFVNTLLEDPLRGCIWIGTEGALFKYTPATSVIETIETFHDNSIKSLALDNDQRLLAATDNGLYVYDETEPLLHIVHDSRNSRSLSNNIIWHIFRDRENNIWLGTEYGISLARYNPDFRFVPIEEITGTGDGNHFYTIYKDADHTLWMGGTNGLIAKETAANDYESVRWYSMGNPSFPLAHNRIRHIFEDDDHHLWIATDGSLNRYEPDKRQFIHYNLVDSSGQYNANWAYSIFEDRHGKLWIGTFLGGIFVVDKQKLLYTAPGRTLVADYTLTTADGLSGMSINQLLEDRDGNVWVLFYNTGINKISLDGTISRIDTEALADETNFSYMICDEEGTLWAGFRGGVLSYHPENGLSHVIRPPLFGDNDVLAMLEVDKTIWVSTTDGLWTIEKGSLAVRRLTFSNKAFSAMYYDRESRQIYLGHVDGMVVTSPGITDLPVPQQPLVVTGLYINNQLVSGSKETGWRSVRCADSFHLSYRQNNLAFELSDLSYSMEEKSKIVYRLVGIDPDWTLLKPNTNRITHSNLSYGKYRLQLSTLDAFGNISEQVRTLEITIRPPWYYTPLAKSLYLLLFLSLIAWTINFFRVKSRLRIERIEKERILEQSRSKIEFITHISHDLKTPLSMIIAPISKLLLEIKNQSERRQLEVVQRNAMRLNSLIHQVLDFNRIDNNSDACLILSRVELVSFAKSLCGVFEEGVIREKEIVFSFRSNCEQLYIDVDVIKLESILNNLLSNACKYTPERGTVALSIQQHDEQLLDIIISDSGIGIPPQDIPYIFQRFFQSPKTANQTEGTGIGLYLVKAYTELHGGTIGVDSIEDRGTTMRVTLPVVLSDEIKGDVPLLVDSVDDHQAPPDSPLILIVDDNAEIAEFIYELLYKNYRCSMADNGKSGYEMAVGQLPDLIISDLMMPVMDGLEMSRKLKKQLPTSTIPILLLTAKNDQQTELESLQLHIDAFIGKPFEPALLLSRVEQLLFAAQQQKRKARIEQIATPQPDVVESLEEKFLSHITRIIEDHVSDSELNVASLSELSGINNKQIYRKLKQLTGMTPVEYIKSIRMKKAAMLLNQHKFSVADVMYMVGYSNHSYFSKCFQAEFGKTPKQFMESI